MTRGQWPAIPALAADLVDSRLVGAACVGRAEWFDDFRPGESDAEREARHAVAARICGRCPVLAACDGVAGELGTSATGIWAGRLRNAGQPVGRPRKAAS